MNYIKNKNNNRNYKVGCLLKCFNKFISVGNKLDMDEVDFLEYLERDPGTGVIAMFLESIARGRRFFEVASAAAKPIVVYKANTTEVGHRTASSHTAALANDDAVVDGVLEQSNVIRVTAIDSLMSTARAFSLPPMTGSRLAVVSQAGGYTVLASDEACRHGFEFPPFTGEMLEGFREYVRSDVIRMGNPLDLGDIHSKWRRTTSMEWRPSSSGGRTPATRGLTPGSRGRFTGISGR